MGRDFEPSCIGEPDMPKAARVSTPVSASAAGSRKSDGSQLVTIALFSGIGLLVSLVAILMGMPIAWY
jgi:hypothetical protein